MRLALSVLALVSLSACEVRKADSNTVAADVANNMTPEGPSLTAQLMGGGKAMPLTVQQPLANGTILYMTSIQAKPTETVIGVKILNGFSRDVQLNWSTKKTFLAAGGQKFYLSPPVENEHLTVNAGASLEGQLVFLGTLPKDAAVTLVINDGLSNSEYTNTPGISVPVPIATAAFSDDGSKKNLAA